MSVPLKRLATVIAGQSPASDDVSELGEGLPFIQGNAEFGARTPTPKWQCDVAPKVALPGDVLVSVRAPVGATNMATMPLGIGRGVAAIRAWRADPDYLYWFVSSSSDLLNAKATGSTFTAVTAADLASLEVPVTDPEEQQRIADYLDRETATIDALIEKQLGLVQGLTERRIAMVRRAVRDDNPSPGIAMRRLFKTRGGTGFPPALQGIKDEEIAFYKVKALGRAGSDGVLTEPEDTVSAETANDLGAAVLPGGTLVMAKIGAALLLGRIRIVDRPSLVDNNMLALTPSGKLWPRYAFYALQGLSLEALVQPGAVPSLNERALRQTLIPVPPLNEQRAIADRLDRETAKIDTLIAKAERFIELAQERRAALITAAVTGQLEIPAEESAA
ncbi:restriction endonuclease subunit S [Brachybacterium sp. EF45031]|uniref:restriction endonuclease subunit S n=1 Tax=Brachybacterium sillae TaxID=2810536 RepID=UPI00217E8B85|nr:restriction endonuclease subunit S [Brachybacterium sillae]MCS6710692.1 restriction endonuclease subunit S [Brachybacterium sillae]